MRNICQIQTVKHEKQMRETCTRLNDVKHEVGNKAHELILAPIAYSGKKFRFD